MGSVFLHILNEVASDDYLRLDVLNYSTNFNTVLV